MTDFTMLNSEYLPWKMLPSSVLASPEVMQKRIEAAFKACGKSPQPDIIITGPTFMLWHRRMSQAIRFGYYVRRWNGKPKKHRRLNFL